MPKDNWYDLGPVGLHLGIRHNGPKGAELVADRLAGADRTVKRRLAELGFAPTGRTGWPMTRRVEWTPGGSGSFAKALEGFTPDDVFRAFPTARYCNMVLSPLDARTTRLGGKPGPELPALLKRLAYVEALCEAATERFADNHPVATGAATLRRHVVTARAHPTWDGVRAVEGHGDAILHALATGDLPGRGRQRPVPLHEVPLDRLLDHPAAPESASRLFEESVSDGWKALQQAVQDLGPERRECPVEGYLLAGPAGNRPHAIAVFDANSGLPVGGYVGGNLWIAPQHRGRGLGSELMIEAFATGAAKPDQARTLSAHGRMARRSAHRKAVERALAAGIDVRPEILADIPEREVAPAPAFA